MTVTSASSIHKLDHEREPVRRAIFELLAPYEAHNLFILGNLNACVADSHLYAAARDGQWIGIAAYYDRFRSLVPFSTDPLIVRALVRYVASLHRPLDWCNAIGYVAAPALEELAALGFSLANDPRQVFMEAPIASEADVPACPHESHARFIRDADGEELVRLLRCMHGSDDSTPVTPTELSRSMLNRQRLVLVVDGRLVSTAATSGVGLSAFQIIGVVTRPEHRRKGYARSVCAALMRIMSRHGARHAVIFTDVDNAPAQRCYESLGFRITSDYAVAKLMAPQCRSRR